MSGSADKSEKLLRRTVVNGPSDRVFFLTVTLVIVGLIAILGLVAEISWG